MVKNEKHRSNGLATFLFTPSVLSNILETESLKTLSWQRFPDVLRQVLVSSGMYGCLVTPIRTGRCEAVKLSSVYISLACDRSVRVNTNQGSQIGSLDGLDCVI